MKEKHILSVFGQVNEEYIEQAASTIGKSKVVSHPRFGRKLSAAMVAAVMCVFLMGAGVVAIIYGDSIQNWFAHQWELITGQTMDEEQTALIDHLSQNVGISQTVDGVTATVDSATVGDDCFYLLLRVEGLELSKRHSYGFEDYTMEIAPDPLEGTAGIGSYGFQYHGLDGDGTALFLIKHDYVSRNGVTEDNRPLDIILTLTNFVQNKNAETDKLLTEGEWNLKFTLDRSQFPATMELPDTEVQLQNLKTKEDVTVTFSNIELTCTGLHFQYNYQGGIIGTVDQITVLLENGATIGISSGGGYPLSDGTLNCSYQWEIPINIDEVAEIKIGNTQIDIPK